MAITGGAVLAGFRSTHHGLYSAICFCVDILAQQRKYEEFTGLKQGTMTVMDYRDKFTRLSRFAPTIVATEEERCKRYEWGLNLNIRAALTTMARDNFDDFVSATIRAKDVE